MKKAQLNIHRLLDGDIPAGEKEVIVRQIQDDPVLRKEFDDLNNAVELLEREGRMRPPLAFTASVMRRLPRRADALPSTPKRFFFGSRVLRWNMAAVMAILLLTVVTTTLLMKQMTPVGSGPGPSSIPSPEQTAMVRLTVVAPTAQHVSVAGDFNKWRTDSHVMTRENGTAKYDHSEQSAGPRQCSRCPRW